VSENAAESFLVGVPAEWAETCRGNGWGDYGNTCWGYAHTESPCATCCLVNKLMQDSAGFVEAQERVNDIENLMTAETDNFPVSLICYRGEKAIPILNVRMDSITIKECPIPGYVNVEYEGYRNDVTGTVPMVDYYTTESE
jgi:hypothetical protein